MSEPRLPRRRCRTAAVGVALLLALLAGCGDDTAEQAGAEGGAPSGGSMVMDEPDATPAAEVDGEVESGAFTVLDTAPPGSDEVAGTAWLAQNDAGTTVTIELTGLEPGQTYVSHLHRQACRDDNGGEHFAFDDAGGDEPPNEVHLGFTAAEDGSGAATVTNRRRVDDGAPSVVIHPVDAVDNRLACADFS